MTLLEQFKFLVEFDEDTVYDWVVCVTVNGDVKVLGVVHGRTHLEVNLGLVFLALEFPDKAIIGSMPVLGPNKQCYDATCGLIKEVTGQDPADYHDVSLYFDEQECRGNKKCSI